jgi:regulator of sirC expression with transglutaminase-like and TPR domain
MDDKKLQALIALLDDPDETVFSMVQSEIMKEDASIVSELEHIWETTLDEFLQNRIENLIQQIQLNDTKNKIRNWAKQEQIDLFDGFFLISRYQYPDLKRKIIQMQIDEIATQAKAQITNQMTSLEKITVLNYVFYDVLKFSINHSNLSSPQNCFINQVLESKKGNPVSLSILYALVARAISLPVFFIDFPKNPLLAFIDPEYRIKISKNKVVSPVLFYINPANKGAIIGRKEIEFFLKKNEHISTQTFDEPCSNKTMVRKLLESLIFAYQELGYQDKVAELTEIAGLL